jgi:DNA-binding NarL/FixJ family response regulator
MGKMSYAQRAERWIDPTVFRGGLPPEEPSLGHETHDTVRSEAVVVIVAKRVLESEGLARSLQEHNSTLNSRIVGSIEQYKDLSRSVQVSAVLVMLGARRVTDPSAKADLTQLVSQAGDVPVVIVAESDEPGEIVAALDAGARGYIPTSVKIKVAAQAICLARAGGIFVPASSAFSLRQVIESRVGSTRQPLSDFTARQAEVVSALRKGKANKIIAYELNLRESTVKVHIRNIMKKLKATNRTEVAYKLRELGPENE